MAGGFWRNPWTYVRLLCIISLSISLGAVVYQLCHPETNLILVISTALTVFLTSFGIGMTAWLRSHTAQQTTDAKFRREGIYQPLYDELLGAVEALNSCQTASLPRWQEISHSSLKESVSPQVEETMRNLVTELDEYKRIWKQALLVAGKEVHFVIQEHLAKATRTHVEGQTSGRAVHDTILQNYKFLFDPKSNEPSDLRSTVANLLAEAGWYAGPPLAAGILRDVRQVLARPGTEVAARATAAEKLMPKLEAARQLVQQRLRRPLS